ncbi:NAD(P)H-binding protein [uncultured Propionibacterium sp.]|uniref:NAD(P)-dependent oxidoreductase n=1 Tax=uncultured Propionibacterium sp. TaxID=218066 RepID=UPI00292CFA76|nr:NAD(P)H-binding protein [uncultured Propionibacterium sp.]
MKLLILGSTGPTGTHVLRRALADGDEVTVLVRSPGRLGELADRLTVVTGDARSADDLTRAMAGAEAVVSALGRNSSRRAEGLFTDAAAAIVESSVSTGTRRLVWLSSYGVGETIGTASLLQKLMYRTILRDLYADKKEAEKILRAAGLDLTIVYPTALTNDEATESYRIGENLPMRGMARISRADVGHFLHKAAHSPEWIGRDAVISS